MSSEAAAQAMRDIRRSLEPAPDDPTAMIATCPGCGNTYRERRGDHHPDCPDCAAARSVSVGEQMRTRSGPAWEKSVRKQLAHWTAEAERLGITREDRPPT